MRPDAKEIVQRVTNDLLRELPEAGVIIGVVIPDDDGGDGAQFLIGFLHLNLPLLEALVKAVNDKFKVTVLNELMALANNAEGGELK